MCFLHENYLNYAIFGTKNKIVLLSPKILIKLIYLNIDTLGLIWNKNFSMFKTKMERMMGIEPTWSAWKAEVLPLNYIRKSSRQYKLY